MGQIHAKKLFIQDVRAGNIILSLPSQEPVLIDFAFARPANTVNILTDADLHHLAHVFGSWPVYGRKLIGSEDEESDDE